jgi:DNA gyrase subunit A
VTLDGRDDEVVGMVVLQRPGSGILAVTRNGFGKRSAVDDYRVTGRGGKGVITIKASQRNGPLVDIHEVMDGDELMITTTGGIVIRLPIKDVSVLGRNTQGVKLINVGDGDAVADVARIVSEDETNGNGNGGEVPEPGADNGAPAGGGTEEAGSGN